MLLIREKCLNLPSDYPMHTSKSKTLLEACFKTVLNNPDSEGSEVTI